MVILGKSYYLEITFSHFIWLLYTKFSVAAYRLWDIVRWTPLRLRRIALHITDGVKNLRDKENIQRAKDLPGGHRWWWSEFGVLLMSLVGTAEIYETVNDILKFNTRSLTPWERELVRSVYGDTINYRRVRIDNLSIVGPRQYRFCYVSFYTINSWGDMSNHLLIHEMMHVWQYQNLGAIYIPRALAAQHSTDGYNYGGLPALEAARAEGKGLDAFNLEQQAEIITDYYLLREGYKAQYAAAARFDLPLYEYFVNQL